MVWLALVLACKDAGPGTDGSGTHTTDGTPTDTATDGTTGTTPPPAPFELVINEVQPANESTWQATDSSTADWVELYNPGTVDADLSRVRIRDQDGLVWIPDSEEAPLAPGEFRILAADGVVGLGHMPFALKALNGGQLTLTIDDFAVDDVLYDGLADDLSWARDVDGTGAFLRTAYPTPGAPNVIQDSDDPRDYIFQPYVMHVITLDVTAEDRKALDDPARPNVEVGGTFDGVYFPQIFASLKGSASYDTMDGKPGFILDLNDIVPGTHWRGAQKLKLNTGNVWDPTRCRDFITYQLGREAGLRASRVGWTELYVADTYYGTYIIIEPYDDQWVAKYWPDQQETGQVWEPDFAGKSDFGNSWWGADAPVTDFNYETGPIPPSEAALTSMTTLDAIAKGAASDANVDLMWTVLEKEEFLSYMAWEGMINNTDGYKAPNNWRFNVDGNTAMIRWLSSGSEWTWASDVSPWSFGGQVASFCISNKNCKHDYAEHLLTMADLTESLDLVTQFSDVSTWLDPYLLKDPRSKFGKNDINDERALTKDHLQKNPGDIRDEVYKTFPDLKP